MTRKNGSRALKSSGLLNDMQFCLSYFHRVVIRSVGPIAARPGADVHPGLDRVAGAVVRGDALLVTAAAISVTQGLTMFSRPVRATFVAQPGGVDLLAPFGGPPHQQYRAAVARILISIVPTIKSDIHYHK